MRAIFTAHSILLNLITVRILGEAYKLRRSSLRGLLQSSATSSLLCENEEMTKLPTYEFTVAFTRVRLTFLSCFLIYIGFFISD